MRNGYRIEKDECVILLRRGGKRGTTFIETRIDAADFDRANSLAGSWTPKWNPTAQTFYARSNGPEGYLHRWILYVTDPQVQIDHQDHDGLNNRRRNLEITSRMGNGFNRRGAERGSKSGRRNVYWNDREKKWMVWLVHFGTRYYAGYFEDIDLADVAAQELRKAVQEK